MTEDKIEGSEAAPKAQNVQDRGGMIGEDMTKTFDSESSDGPFGEQKGRETSEKHEQGEST
jgi:hypothetical protein